LYLLLCVGFLGANANPPPPSTPVYGTKDLDGAFKKCRFKMGSKNILAYVADNEMSRERGLMYVNSLPSDTGMLFVFEASKPLAFWMKNTHIPLAIGYLDERFRLREVIEMKVVGSLIDLKQRTDREFPTYQSRDSVLLALEMNTGWFARNKVSNGSKLSVEGKCESSLLATHLQRLKKPGP